MSTFSELNHPSNLDQCLLFISKIIESGNSLLIVSKPHIECIRKICTKFSYAKDKILFRFSIGSCKNDTLNFWEPGAPNFNERLRCLKYAYKQGFQTSISCEPMLDDKIEELIKKINPYVTDTIWLGKINFLMRRLRVNHACDEVTLLKAKQLLKFQCDENIHRLYSRFRNNPMIRWKDSIKKVVGLKSAPDAGLDI